MKQSRFDCCNQSIEVKTVDDMLDKAYNYIKSDQMLQRLLQKLNLKETTIGIAQNYTRKLSMSKSFSNSIDRYRDIQGTDANIFLNFNESFDYLEAIEIFPDIFDDCYIRGWYRQFSHLADKQKIKWLEELFLIISPKFQGVSKLLRYDTYDKGLDGKHFMLEEDHPQLKDGSWCATYPEEMQISEPFILFEFDSKIKNGKLQAIRVEFAKKDNMKEVPIDKWLHQETIQMYPDYGDVVFWFSGKAGCTESFGENYDFETNEIHKRVDDWLELFYDNNDKFFPDWKDFNVIGEKLLKDVQKIVKDRYIISYYKSCEELFGNEEERKHLGKDF